MRVLAVFFLVLATSACAIDVGLFTRDPDVRQKSNLNELRTNIETVKLNGVKLKNVVHRCNDPFSCVKKNQLVVFHMHSYANAIGMPTVLLNGVTADNKLALTVKSNITSIDPQYWATIIKAHKAGEAHDIYMGMCDSGKAPKADEHRAVFLQPCTKDSKVNIIAVDGVPHTSAGVYEQTTESAYFENLRANQMVNWVDSYWVHHNNAYETTEAVKNLVVNGKDTKKVADVKCWTVKKMDLTALFGKKPTDKSFAAAMKKLQAKPSGGASDSKLLFWKMLFAQLCNVRTEDLETEAGAKSCLEEMAANY